jgi:hypothetical protein
MIPKSGHRFSEKIMLHENLMLLLAGALVDWLSRGGRVRRREGLFQAFLELLLQGVLRVVRFAARSWYLATARRACSL